MNQNLTLNCYFFLFYRGSTAWYKPLLFFLLQFVLVAGNAQPDSATIEMTGAPKTIFSASLGVHYGFIFVHSTMVEYSRGSNPRGAEFNIAWQKTDSTTVNSCNCFPRNGFMITYYDLDNPVLGKSIGASFFLEPTYRIAKNTFFSFRGSIGLAYLTNPFDSLKNPGNESYSSAVSFLLSVGVGLWFRLSDHWWLNGAFNFNHLSNGGMQYPNLGVNWPTAGANLNYQINPMPYYKGIRVKDRSWRNNSIRWDAYLFGMATRPEISSPDKLYPIFGAGFQGGKQVSKLNAIIWGAEVFTDPGCKEEIKQNLSTDVSPIRAGLMVGNEFILGRVLFSQRIGAYVFNETANPTIFHRWGLLYRVSQHWSLGFSFMAHKKSADFFDAKIAYSWQKRHSKL